MFAMFHQDWNKSGEYQQVSMSYLWKLLILLYGTICYPKLRKGNWKIPVALVSTPSLLFSPPIPILLSHLLALARLVYREKMGIWELRSGKVCAVLKKAFGESLWGLKIPKPSQHHHHFRDSYDIHPAPQLSAYRIWHPLPYAWGNCLPAF